jgi:hypothetical protein
MDSRLTSSAVERRGNDESFRFFLICRAIGYEIQVPLYPDARRFHFLPLCSTVLAGLRDGSGVM